MTSLRFLRAFRPLRSRREKVSSKKQSKITSILVILINYVRYRLQTQTHICTRVLTCSVNKVARTESNWHKETNENSSARLTI